MADMQWGKAILQALRDDGHPMHYAEIAQRIIDSGYRVNVGATPANTVAAFLSESLRNDRKSPFVKVDRGVYGLQGTVKLAEVPELDEPDEAEKAAQEMGLINAFGMWWERERITWKPVPRLLGVQQFGGVNVDFTEQAGVYVLYDMHRPIYVGKAADRRLGPRLYEHTRDRLTGRWNRFSWFGVKPVNDRGALEPLPSAGIAVVTLIATMEALLIEGLEPVQNRRQGDGFNAVEFLQVTDPDIEKAKQLSVLERLTKNAGLS